MTREDEIGGGRSSIELNQIQDNILSVMTAAASTGLPRPLSSKILNHGNETTGTRNRLAG